MARAGGEDRGLFERPKGSGVWWIRYHDHSGKERREKVGKKTAARQLYQKRKEEARLGVKLPENLSRPDAGRLTLAELIDRYRQEVRTNKKSWREDERHAGYWVEAFGDRFIDELTPGDVEGWKAQRLKQVAPATVNRSLAFLKTTFSRAIRDGLCEKNPLAGRRVKMLRENNHRDRILSREEEALIEPHLARQDWLAVVVDLQTGLRQAEQLGLRRTDVDLTRAHIRLKDSKGGGAVTIRLNPVALEAFRELLTLHQSRWVFPDSTGESPLTGSALFHRFTRACHRAGVEGVIWHTLRHTFISRLVMLGVPLRVVQEAARHKSLNMTLRYSHLQPGTVQGALDTLAAAYPPPLSQPVSEPAPEPAPPEPK